MSGWIRLHLWIYNGTFLIILSLITRLSLISIVEYINNVKFVLDFVNINDNS